MASDPKELKYHDGKEHRGGNNNPSGKNQFRKAVRKAQQRQKSSENVAKSSSTSIPMKTVTKVTTRKKNVTTLQESKAPLTLKELVARRAFEASTGTSAGKRMEKVRTVTTEQISKQVRVRDEVAYRKQQLKKQQERKQATLKRALARKQATAARKRAAEAKKKAKSNETAPHTLAEVRKYAREHYGSKAKDAKKGAKSGESSPHTLAEVQKYAREHYGSNAKK